MNDNSARQAHEGEASPANLYVIGTVDEVVPGGQVIFHK